MRIDYVATGIFFAWLSLSIFRWVARTAAEVEDAPPPSRFIDDEILREAAVRSGRRLREEQ